MERTPMEPPSFSLSRVSSSQVIPCHTRVSVKLLVTEILLTTPLRPFEAPQESPSLKRIIDDSRAFRLSIVIEMKSIFRYDYASYEYGSSWCEPMNKYIG